VALTSDAAAEKPRDRLSREFWLFDFRLLQQYRPLADVRRTRLDVRFQGYTGRGVGKVAMSLAVLTSPSAPKHRAHDSLKFYGNEFRKHSLLGENHP
jgi:hypothetical protein